MFDGISTFSFPTPIIFGPGAIERLPEALRECGASRPLLVTDPGLRAAAPFARVVEVLETARQAYEVFDAVHPNPVEADIESAVAAYRTAGCDSVIGLGGGSAMDAAKAVAVCATGDAPLAAYEAQAGGMDKIARIAETVGPLPPVIAIPTTAGTGSEVGRAAVITSHELGRKIIIFSPLLMPRRAILDPELTVGLPAPLTAATGMDAFTHCIESLTAPVFHPLCDAIAVGGLELVIKYLERATSDGADIEARGMMQIAASMGAIAFQKDLGATHSLAHPLSTEFGVHHGLANAICLPAVMEFNREAASGPYARLAGLFENAAGGLREMPELDAADLAIDHVERLLDRLGLTRRLRDCGEGKITREALAALAVKAFEDSCHLTNPRPCTQDDLLGLYEKCW